ncbi:hypothetical protein FJT64_021745 [Amphibalanus amphitrite]|uniref:Uncharacterized protein n=1 Tax=Amphibalanus amphitrite TaxID=1232801 RepID=A0A6A4WWR0_AMPAM|nr:hypothetical protein FJT64_021745 [Amphibalanus amphitrite]
MRAMLPTSMYCRPPSSMTPSRILTPLWTRSKTSSAKRSDPSSLRSPTTSRCPRRSGSACRWSTPPRAATRPSWSSWPTSCTTCVTCAAPRPRAGTSSAWPSTSSGRRGWCVVCAALTGRWRSGSSGCSRSDRCPTADGLRSGE